VVIGFLLSGAILVFILVEKPNAPQVTGDTAYRPAGVVCQLPGLLPGGPERLLT